MRRIGGIELPQTVDPATCLERLEFLVEDAGDYLLVTSPDHRLDIEGSHDLVEEVCRMYGYDRIPEGQMADALPPNETIAN